MRDKEIIIDDIDVSKCIYLDIEEDAPNYPEIGGTYTAFECNLYSRDCDFIERCRYKQLLRKEQECEDLKRKHNENLTVQKQLQEWQDEDLRQIKDLKQTIQELNESIQTCNVERTKLYRKLSKIEEFCKELMSENEEYISINQVLQIIRGEE